MVDMSTEATVIIPVGAKHLGLLPRAIASVEAQTVNASVLVANNSGTVVRSDSRLVSVIDVDVPQDMTGAQKAAYSRNKALEQVDTPFVVFLDADDTLTQPAIEVMLNRFKQGRAGWVYGDWWSVRGDKPTYTHALEFDRKTILRRNLHAVTALVPTDRALQVKGFDLNLPYFEDWGFWLRMAAAGYEGVRVPYATFSYYLDAGENREKGVAYTKETPEMYHYVDTTYGVKLRELDMACSSCGGSTTTINRSNNMAKAGSGDLVTLEFIGGGRGDLTYRHPVSRRSYTGGNNETNRFAYAPESDVDWLVNGTGQWQVVAKPSVPDAPFQPKEAPAGVTETEVDGDYVQPKDVGDAGAYVVPTEHSQQPKAKRGK